MFNPLNLISKFIKTSNQKELDRVGSIVKKINSLENEIKKLGDVDFPNKTQEFKNQIKKGKIKNLKSFFKAAVFSLLTIILLNTNI